MNKWIHKWKNERKTDWMVNQLSQRKLRSHFYEKKKQSSIK